MSRFDERAETAARTPLRESEAQSAQEERELPLTIDAIPALVTTFQPDGTCSFVNQTWRDYTGLALQDEARSIHPEDRERAESAWRASVASGQPFRMELRLRGRDGNHRWHTVRRVPLRDRNGDVTGWYGAAFDIGDQKVAENAAAQDQRTRELDFRLIIDSIPAPVAVMTPAGEVEGVNRPVLEYFGKTFEEVKGWATSDAVHPDDLPRVAAVWMAAIQTGPPYEVESRHRRADGVYRWFHIRGFP